MKKGIRRGGQEFLVALAAVVIILLPVLGHALEPRELLVLANQNAASSVGLARYYIKARGVPEENFLALWLTDQEYCGRDAYTKQVATRVRRFLREKDQAKRIRCLVLMFGLPLRIEPDPLSPQEQPEMDELQRQQQALKLALEDLGPEDEEKRVALEEEMTGLSKRLASLRKDDEVASLDSELALVLDENYQLAGFLPNPQFFGYRGNPAARRSGRVLMVARLDGPDEKTVRRIIDDSIATEKVGLSGIAYFDARRSRPAPGTEKEAGHGYGLYDLSIHLAAERVRKDGRLAVVLDDKTELFSPGSAPDAALYCGWYSLAKYVGAFTWRRGAVGFHIASSECATLKQKGSQVWCKRMLEEGVAATVGPVSEPYVQGFPVPEIFFNTLLEGRLTLAECYALALPFVSWRLVLIGDPLYAPFKTRGTVKSP